MSISIAERIAALNKKAEEGDAPPPPAILSKPKANKNLLADKIAALSIANGGDNNDDITKSDMSKSKVGKLKPPPAGAIPIMSFGGGPPPSLLKKQKEREERMERMKQEAALESNEDGECEEVESENPKEIGKLKMPEGAVPIMFGAGPPPSLLKKQKEREERMEKMRQEAAAHETTDVSAGVGGADENADDALLSRPTIQGKRRPRTRA